MTGETVAVRRPEGGARILRFDPATNAWVSTGMFELFHPLGDKRYAMVV